jgi:ribosome-binding factor A
MKFLPRVHFVGDRSFDYAAKIEKLIQQNKWNYAEAKK